MKKSLRFALAIALAAPINPAPMPLPGSKVAAPINPAPMPLPGGGHVR
jgi:hypothetical protein